MSVTGVVTNVSPTRSGDTLAADTLATDTVLLLDDAGDFDEEFAVPRFLVIGDETTPRQYVAGRGRVVRAGGHRVDRGNPEY